ncbi:hypothetical protein NX059_009854 [Plenodomus lindquistii]|nr:hypothetical protein NX059_009854 [Plenodomus lindquistii]
MIQVDGESQESIKRHGETLGLNGTLGMQPRSLHARPVILDTMKQQKKTSSVKASRTLQTHGGKGHSSRKAVHSAVSKPGLPRKRKCRTPRPKAKTPRDDRPIAKHDKALVPFRDSNALDATLDLTISNPNGSLPRRRASHFEEAKQSDDAIYPPKHIPLEQEVSSNARSESSHATIASELAFYKERYEEAKHECLIFKDQRRQIESLGKLPGDVTKVLIQNTRRIANLKKKLEDRTDLDRYFSFHNSPKATPTSHRVAHFFGILRNSIATVLVMEGAKKYHVERLIDTSNDLDGLLVSIYGTGILRKSRSLSTATPRPTSFELMQALTGAAICSWVFESEFRPHVMDTSPLLHEYQSLITTCCGHESLCNLDLAVHQSIVEKESFKEVIIPQMSELLTTRLTHALQPFFQVRFRRKAMKKLRPSLGTAFKSALEIRSESLLSPNHFQLIWPVAGETVNEVAMESQSSNPTLASNLVRLPLCPGVRAYVKKKAVVDYGGFAKEPLTGLRQDYVVKALVLN